MKRIISFSAILLALAIVVVSCGGSKSRPLEESVSAFLHDNDAVIGFGSARLNDILAKTDYQQESKIKAFLNEPVGQLNSSLNLDAPIYFVIEGPVDNGNPSATYLFLEVKDRLKLIENLEKNGFEIINEKKIDYVSDGDMNLSFDDKLAIVVIKSGVDDPKTLLTQVRKRTFGDVSEGQTASILAKKSDLVFGTSLANLYGTSNTDLEDLSEEKQKELRAMLQNSYVENDIRFENGELIFETKNHFSKELKSKLFFRKDGSANVLNNLGNGQPRIGVSLNIDSKKLQEFLSEYAPETLNDLSEDIGGPFAMAMMLSNNDISKLIDGRAAAIVVGDATKVMEGMTPDLNFFVGLAGQGRNYGEALKSTLVENFKVVNLTDAGIAAFSNAEFAGKGILLTEASKGFGQNTFDLFIDLDGLDLSEFQLEGGGKMVEIIQSIRIHYNEDGGKLVIKAKDGKENILKQALTKVLNVFEDEIAL